ncbi:uncharacterized protein LOC120457825 [Drosophila santomea]|uniref:uncharacterized protein LOC120457825 n=1 Tax=Drosophila santomea TaxID=129105 RepID=UPI0019533E84|nr:uncharacterized protein LOC120457825 [Drosophila santomea]
MYLTMPNYTTPYRNRCIGCGAEEPVRSIQGCQFKVPQIKDLNKPHSCGLEDFPSEKLSSKKAMGCHSHRQSKKHRNSYRRKLNNGLKWSPICTKKRANPDVVHLRQPKQKSVMSSEPFYKAVILREMIRLGRQPNRKFEKAARNAQPINEMNYDSDTLQEQVPYDIETAEACKPCIVEMKEVSASPSFENNVQMRRDNNSKEFKILNSTNCSTPFESFAMDAGERGTPGHNFLEKPMEI